MYLNRRVSRKKAQKTQKRGRIFCALLCILWLTIPAAKKHRLQRLDSYAAIQKGVLNATFYLL
ncbi:MAG: hypothetical protein A2W17_07865 [Planctomycetes bacterium RBG_16_41_13]|nr:MAG: hypothetical protein A2W17_07865 [Planctomycetes bacterium RBG_16_41_13]